jgi:transposase
MAYNFLHAARDQPFLPPPDLRDWLPQGHLAWFILDVVDRLDLQPFYRQHRDDGHGHPACDPRTVLGVLLYGYCIGVRSPRQLERRCQEDIAFRVLAATQTPDHVNIAGFRVRHEQVLAGFFVESLKLCGRRDGPGRHRGTGRDQAGRQRRRRGQPRPGPAVVFPLSCRSG